MKRFGAAIFGGLVIWGVVYMLILLALAFSEDDPLSAASRRGIAYLTSPLVVISSAAISRLLRRRSGPRHPDLDLSDAALRELRDLLAGTFDETIGIRRLLREAGVPTARVRFGDTALTAWESALEVSTQHGLLTSVLERALDHSPALAPRFRQLGFDPTTRQT